MRRFVGLVVIGLAADTSSHALSRRPEYGRDVAPLLARACLSCHAGEHPKGGLHLDRPAGLATVVHPGAASDSEIMRRIRGQGGEQRMPAGAAPLPEVDVSLLQRWIDQGAAGLPTKEDQARAHWAYQPPQRRPLPATVNRRWPRNPVDRFILARLESAHLSPAPEADAETLIRRVTIDLTGLPPTPDEIDAFLADATRPALAGTAYERVVDRLLASPAFGERWAVPWLDAARYADSNGYEKDGARAIWKYRDWVVAALNADMPFDRFTTEQIAGDLLPGAGDAQKIATGFHRNTMLNEEGGVDPEEARFERLCDRVTTTATVWLGSTLGCARCHDHKHDPFTQRDFYSMLAFFEDGREETLALPPAALGSQLAAWRAELAALEVTLNTWTPALGQAQRAWERELLVAPARFSALSRLTRATSDDRPLIVESDGAVFVGARRAWARGERARAEAAPADQLPREELQTIEGDTPLSRVTAVRVEALPDARLPAGGPGRGHDGGFFLSGVDLAAAPVADPNARWQPLRIARVVADDHPREEPERYAADNLMPDHPRPPSLDADVARGWGVAANRDGARRLPRQLVLIPDTPLSFSAGTRVRVRLHYGAAAQGEVIGRLRMTASAAAAEQAAAVAALDAGLLDVVRTPAAARTTAQGNALAASFRETTPLLAEARARRAEIEQQRGALGVDSTLVMAPVAARAAGPLSGSTPSGPRGSATALVPPSTRLHPRGSFASTGDQVAAAVPAVLAPAAGAPAPHDRLAFARWLTSEGNPLAARAAVNRIWAQYFGRGLLETTEDFGHLGGAVTHPELLDWLAVELASSGWRLKALHRLIVTSATYRQASAVAAASQQLLAARDPDSHLLARGPRRRLDAEEVRDVILSASGLLDHRIGGRPVFPPQPAGVWAPPNSHEDPWPTTEGSDRYRRALYVFWRRTAPYPTSALFDAPTREVCTVRRNHTSTPLQALATLNDPAFWEAAQALGRDMADPVSGAHAPVAERIAAGFRRCTGRRPTRAEVQPLVTLLDGQRARIGDAAAWALMANVLLNLDETLTNH